MDKPKQTAVDQSQSVRTYKPEHLHTLQVFAWCPIVSHAGVTCATMQGQKGLRRHVLASSWMDHCNVDAKLLARLSRSVASSAARVLLLP